MHIFGLVLLSLLVSLFLLSCVGFRFLVFELAIITNESRCIYSVGFLFFA